MNDHRSLSAIAKILHTPICSSRTPKPSVLPHVKIRIQTARAYAVLRIVDSHLTGLKKMEADAALEFFPPCGFVSGRHTTDEFLSAVWEGFARRTLTDWNSHRREPLSCHELDTLAKSWLQGRIARSRRFVSVTPSYQQL